VVLDIQAQANAPPRGLADQGVQQHSSDPATADVRPYPNSDLGRTAPDSPVKAWSKMKSAFTTGYLVTPAKAGVQSLPLA
jgi:hypothetical protein